MKWLRIDANITRNPKVASVRGDGLVLYLRGLCYCAEHETDGIIPRHAVPAMVDDFIHMGLWITQQKGGQVSGKCPASVRNVTVTDSVTGRDTNDDDDPGEGMTREAFDRRRRRLVKRLVDAGLWHETPDGYAVNDYLEYQPERSELEERDERRKVKARERKRRERARKRGDDVSGECPNVTPVTPHTIRGYSLRNNPPVGRDANSGGTPALEGAGAPVAPVDELPSAEVAHVIDEHGPQAIVRRLREAKRMP